MADIGWESEGRILDVKNRTIGIWESDYAALKAERDELQERIAKALVVLETLPPLPVRVGGAYWRKHASNVEALMSKAIRILEGNDE